jgi:hypothetical protein
MAPSPSNADFLGYSLIEEFQLDQVAGNAHSFDTRPPQRWLPQCNPTILENAGALELAHVEAFIRQFLDCQATAALLQYAAIFNRRPALIFRSDVTCHGATINV